MEPSATVTSGLDDYTLGISEDAIRVVSGVKEAQVIKVSEAYGESGEGL